MVTITRVTNNEEGNLYQIVLASTYQIGRIKSYLRRFVEKADVLDMDAYRDLVIRETGSLNTYSGIRKTYDFSDYARITRS